MINRAAVIVRPRKPYLDWAAGLDDLGTVPNSEGEQTVYLMHREDLSEDVYDDLENYFDSIFYHELLAWHLDEVDWPKNRTFKMFREWFDIEIHSIVEDLGGPVIFNEEF